MILGETTPLSKEFVNYIDPENIFLTEWELLAVNL